VRSHAVAGEMGGKTNRTHMAALLLKPRFMSPVFAVELSVLDVSVMAAIRALGDQGEPDVYAEVARLFLADVPVHLSALNAAIAARSAKSVEQIAHRLRGGALEIGALRMAPLCADIECAARAGSLERAASQATRLNSEFAVARLAIEQEIQ
jgi:HPt (histidine-containing phosphotransfer) domain-containing protein